VRPVNRLKRFIYACLAKRFGDNFDDAIVIYECTVELRIYNPTNWRKDGQPELRATGGKLGKPKLGKRQHFPYGHRFYMDNDPKYTSKSTKRFILLNNINHFPTPPESPVKNYSFTLNL
jgi:hypothetical protein